MPVAFRIKSISIDNFRGVKSLQVEFHHGTPLYLIGGNNTGKSTVINAIALTLKGGGFHTFAPEEYDFFHDAKNVIASPFTVELHFGADEPEHLPAVQGVGNPIPVHGIRVIGRQTERRYEHRHVLVNGEAKPITISPRTALKGEVKEKFRDHGVGWAQYYARLDDIHQFLPEVWLLRSDNLAWIIHKPMFQTCLSVDGSHVVIAENRFDEAEAGAQDEQR